MTTIIITLHVLVAVLLILIVLLQSGKGATMGISMGGGGGQTLFGAAGPANILTKITTAVAVLFMLTSLTLAYLSGYRSETSIMEKSAAPAPQAEETIPPETTVPAAGTTPVTETETGGDQPAAQQTGGRDSTQ